MIEPDEVDVSPFVTPQTRVEQGRRLRNPRVKALLDAGMSLIMRSVDGGIDNPFQFPSALAVCGEAAQFAPFRSNVNPLNSAKNAYTKTWPTKARFDADLAMYILTFPEWFSEDPHAETTITELIGRGGDIRTVFQQIAYYEVELFESKHFRLQVLMQAMAPDEPLIAAALDQMYQKITAIWSHVVKGVLDHYALRLRPGISATELTIMLSAAGEGIALRRLVYPDDSTLKDPTRGTTLFASAVFAVFSACVQCDGDDRTLALLSRDVANRGRGLPRARAAGR